MYQTSRYLVCQYAVGGRKYPNLDCWGLVIEFYRAELNINLPLEEGIKSSTEAYKVENEVKSQIHYVEVDKPSKDKVYVVCFYTSNSRLTHCGIYLNNHILHINSKGCMYQPLSLVKSLYKRWSLKFYEVTH